MGRLSYLPDFTWVWLDGEEYDLRERLKARLCLQFLIEQEAFAEASARRFETEINPYVRTHSMREPQRENAEIKIHHYFNPSTGRLAKLGRGLIQLAGHGTGCYYLKVI